MSMSKYKETTNLMSINKASMIQIRYRDTICNIDKARKAMNTKVYRHESQGNEISKECGAKIIGYFVLHF